MSANFCSSTIRVWYLLFDGLTSAVVNCPRQYQSKAVDTLFEIFNTMQKQVSSTLLPLARLLWKARGGMHTTQPSSFISCLQSALLKSDISVQSCEGRGDPQLIKFGVYCTNHLLLPMLQSWLRRCQRTFQGWLASGPNFKHCMGRTTELVMTWLKGPYT